MKKMLLALAVMMLLLTSNYSFGWSRSGHNAVAAIAERNLTPKTKERVEKLLGNHSIVYYASWMDYYRNYPQYKATSSWHTAPVNKDLYYTDELFKEPGNAIYGLEYAIKNLKHYKDLSDSTVAVNLYYIIHIVGDMHCPVHVKYQGINTKYTVLMGDKEINYHTIWDGNVMDDNHLWSYTEAADQLDRCTPQQKAAIMKGTPRDWFHQTAVDCIKIYGMVEPKGTQILTKERVFMNDAQALAESQIQKAGYRLAKVLNDLFGK